MNKGKIGPQRDYNLGFKLVIISQVENSEMTYKQARKAPSEFQRRFPHNSILFLIISEILLT